jgi:gamma-glutamyltranspeptidase/glutathione hydrolase
MKKFLVAFLLFVSLPAALFAECGVVTSADPRATEAGREILRAGGSATDAALAMMLALTVVEPQSSGIGGGGFIIHHDARTRETRTIDGRESAPSSATPRQFLKPDGTTMGFREAVPGGRSVGVPGNIALMGEAHRRWGKLRWKRLFQPAIRLAEQGYVVTPRLAGVIGNMKNLWADFPAAQAIYWKEGRPVKAGETVRNPALAALLRRVAARGPKAFYSGQNAAAIVDATASSKRNPAIVTLQDIVSYKAKERDAVCVPYRVYTLCGMGPPSSGATTVFQILGMVERFDLQALGKDNPDAWHLIGEAMRLAYADRETYLGDPDFVSVPVSGLLDRDYVAARSALISVEKALGRYEAGSPPGAGPRTSGISGEAAGTTHFVAVDRKGNVASMTSTVEGPFGSQLVANGYFLNNELTDFTWVPERNGAPVANRVEPGKRPLSSMSPTIVFDRSGAPVFAVGAAGGKRIIMQVAKTLIARLDWGLSAHEALAAPNIYFTRDALLVEADTPLAAMQVALAAKGQTVVASDLMPSKANAAELTPQGWRGAADPRSDGNALEE